MTPATSPDEATLRRAARRVAVRISAACAVMVLCLLTGATIFLVNQLARPEVPGSGAPASEYVFLDSKDLLKALVITGIAGVVLAGVVGWLSARSAIRPLGEALRLQRRFVQDASHELRTPLAILDARIQLAQRDTTPDSKTGQSLSQIRDDTATLTAIVSELLLAATGDGPDSPMHRSDLADAAEYVAASVQQLAEEQDVRIVVSTQCRPLVSIDQNRLRRAVLALIDNALTHTPAGGEITVTTAMDKSLAVIEVKDTGSGITGVDQAKIFDRFVRSPNADGSQRRRSFGIGLALVREIATDAGGTIEITRTGPQGTVMTFNLPLAGP